jgi:hypothetical protein
MFLLFCGFQAGFTDLAEQVVFRAPVPHASAFYLPDAPKALT